MQLRAYVRAGRSSNERKRGASASARCWHRAPRCRRRRCFRHKQRSQPCGNCVFRRRRTLRQPKTQRISAILRTGGASRRASGRPAARRRREHPGSTDGCRPSASGSPAPRRMAFDLPPALGHRPDSPGVDGAWPLVGDDEGWRVREGRSEDRAAQGLATRPANVAAHKRCRVSTIANDADAALLAALKACAEAGAGPEDPAMVFFGALIEHRGDAAMREIMASAAPKLDYSAAPWTWCKTTPVKRHWEFQPSGCDSDRRGSRPTTCPSALPPSGQGGRAGTDADLPCG